MHVLKFLFRTMGVLIFGMLSLCWSSLLFFIELIDGGDEDPSPRDNITWYNYRTGEIDPVERNDGLYDDSW